VITQRRLHLAILMLTASCAYTNCAAAQADACAEGYVWREAFDGDRVCVSPATREQAQADNATAAQRRAAAAVPLPPAKLGCHTFREGEWREIPCATEEEAKRMPRPEVAIENRSRVISFFGDIPFRPALKYARIDIDLLSDPALGSVTDVRQAGRCAWPNDQARNLQDSFSVQVNTNFFNTSYGGQGWVQFVIQSPNADGDALDGLCVWKVDVMANGYDNSASCVRFRRDRTFLGSAADRRRRSVSLFGLVQRENGARMLTAVAGIPWEESGPLGAVYAVTTTDTIKGRYRGLQGDNTEYPLGLSERDNWWQASGDIYGNGCGSRAEFRGTTFFETLTVATCNPFDPICLSAPMTPFSLPHYAVGLLRGPPQGFTGETNNLTSSASVSLNYSCSQSTLCRTWRGSRSP
jgi:hypothetical protein